MGCWITFDTGYIRTFVTECSVVQTFLRKWTLRHARATLSHTHRHIARERDPASKFALQSKDGGDSDGDFAAFDDSTP